MINLDQELRAPNGQSIMEPVEFDDAGKPKKVAAVTLGAACYSALIQPVPNVPVTEAVKLYRLAEKMAKGGEVALSVEEIAMMIKALDRANFTPPVKAAVGLALDPNIS